MKNKTERKSKGIFIYFVILFFVIIFNSICFHGAKTTDEYITAADKYVRIEAVITSSDKYTEIDEGMESDYWHANVSYTYNGVEYSGVHYDTTYSEPEIGKVVTVKINPDNPGEIVPGTYELIIALGVSVLFLTGISLVVFDVVKGIVEDIADSKENIKKENAQKIAAVSAGGLLVIESVVYYLVRESLVFALFSLIAALIAVIVNLKKAKKKKSQAAPDEA